MPSLKLSDHPGYNEVEFELLRPCVGIKQVNYTPMTLGDYNKLKGWDQPKDEDPSAAGYLIEYSDDYISWSPKHVFDDAYKASGEMTFAMALFMTQNLGVRIHRSGWNGQNQYVLNIKGDAIAIGVHQCYGDPTGEKPNVKCADALFIKTTQGTMFPWFPSPGDMAATDWCVY